jgi:murein endopeptidase
LHQAGQEKRAAAARPKAASPDAIERLELPAMYGPESRECSAEDDTERTPPAGTEIPFKQRGPLRIDESGERDWALGAAHRVSFSHNTRSWARPRLANGETSGIVRAMPLGTEQQAAFSVLLMCTACASAPRLSGVPRPPERTAPAAVAPVAHTSENPPGAASTRPRTSESDDAEDEGDEGPDDEGDVEPAPDATVQPAHPFASLSNAELEQRLLQTPLSLGSMSIGKPNGGLLFNGVALPPGEAWTVVAPGEAWATDETIRYLETAIREVTRERPGGPKLSIGDISAKGGGYLRPHLSHQSGRDVDISYFYLDGERWYRRATAENLDAPRTWAFVRALVTLTDVDLLLIDHSIQTLLRDYAEGIGEDRAWLDTLFHGRDRIPPIIRHAPGHATHLHIRFYNPIAQETGRRCYAALVRHGMVHVGAAYVSHVARKGETLAHLAKRYGTTVRAIRRANGLKSTLIQAKRSYRIPQTGHAPPSTVTGPIAIPPRRLPPSREPVAGKSTLR